MQLVLIVILLSASAMPARTSQWDPALTNKHTNKTDKKVYKQIKSAWGRKEPGSGQAGRKQNFFLFFLYLHNGIWSEILFVVFLFLIKILHFDKNFFPLKPLRSQEVDSMRAMDGSLLWVLKGPIINCKEFVFVHYPMSLLVYYLWFDRITDPFLFFLLAACQTMNIEKDRS